MEAQSTFYGVLCCGWAAWPVASSDTKEMFHEAENTASQGLHNCSLMAYMLPILYEYCISYVYTLSIKFPYYLHFYSVFFFYYYFSTLLRNPCYIRNSQGILKNRLFGTHSFWTFYNCQHL